MSWSKIATVLSLATFVVGLCSTAARSQDGPGPRDAQRNEPGTEERVRPDGAPAAADPFRDQPRPKEERGAEQSPAEPRGDWRQPPSDPNRRGRPLREGLPAYPQPRPNPFEAPAARWSIQPYVYQMDPKTDPELYSATVADRDLESASRAKADEYRRAATAEDKAKIKEKLVEIVNRHFDVRQTLRNLEVKRLEQQVKQLRDKIELRVKNRKDLVDKRLIELTGEVEGERF